jgi:maltooligosyltrehalose trehalohydrolase
VSLEAGDLGYYHADVPDVAAGDHYLYRLDGKKECPDPASRSQPAGVHGPTEVTDPEFRWNDAGWVGLALSDLITYELHVGTFSQAGTFDGIIPRLGELRDLGINALELMPVAQFPGERNWGYDGVFPFAVQNSYGGPQGLKRLVDACHRAELAVVLDVVYNHLGPEGNYLGNFAPYFTGNYFTPWGPALNFDGAHSDEVRKYFTANALYWQSEFHMDALRLDAVHEIRDFSTVPFLEELAVAVRRQAESTKRRFHLIAESALNNSRFVLPRDRGGYGLDAQWSDDFHHSLHALLTGERQGYYCDYDGLTSLARAMKEGQTYSGEYSVYYKRKQGTSTQHSRAAQFVVCAQNHDQIGNRVAGDRLTGIVSFESLKLAASVLLLSPYPPLLFMGEEYGEKAPFQYFVSHADPRVTEAVRKGRRAECKAFGWVGEAPDPQDEATFLRSRIDPSVAAGGDHKILRDFYRELISLRKGLPALRGVEKEDLEVRVYDEQNVLLVRSQTSEESLRIFHFGKERVSVELTIPSGRWRKRLDSSLECWGGGGSPVPNNLESHGSVWLELPERSALFLERESPSSEV